LDRIERLARRDPASGPSHVVLVVANGARIWHSGEMREPGDRIVVTPRQAEHLLKNGGARRP
jgi:hypothetical protein